MQPRHAHIPDIGLDNNLLFELVAFVHSVMVLCLQYINLYKTVWWLPHSNANYALVSIQIREITDILCRLGICS